ncbi:MAG: tetratricopeptide repeat protein, partial [Planctomycetaceae bacterium]
MSLDPYSPCPCGSGKKLKFCCQVVAADIEKVERLLEGRQKSRAVQALEALGRKHPDNPWVVTTRSEVLMQEALFDEAAELLEPFVEAHPDHHYALALMAVASFSADGFELAKPIIHRAFQRCRRDYPDMLADLALGVASSMLGTGKYLAARAHLVLALRLAPDEMKSQIFLRLIDFDGNVQIPYPLRSVHEIAEVAGADEKGSDAHKAVLLSTLGCWRPAARIFTRPAEA